MKRSLTASVLIHAALLLGGFAVLPTIEQKPVAEEVAVVVDISNISDKTAIKAETRREVPKQDKPKAELTEVTKDVKPVPDVAEEVVEHAKIKDAEPAPKPEVKPEDKPVEDTKLEELLKAEAEAQAKAEQVAELALKKKLEDEVQKKKDEVKKLEEKKKKDELAAKKKKEADEKKKKAEKFDVAAIEDLLQDKSQEKKTAPKKSGETDGSPDQGKLEVQGEEAVAKATFKDALVARIRECFKPPAAALDDNIKIVVDVDFTLNQDGTLKGPPKPAQTGDFLLDAVALAASSAVVECQPYNFFPPGKYKGYARWILSFDPRDTRG